MADPQNLSSAPPLPWIAIGCLSALMAVIMGAFGAHALAQRLSEKMLDVFKTGAQYQMYHSVALILFGLWCSQQPVDSISQAPAWAFVAGLFLFSGSLYVLALSGLTWLGAITPLGGLSFMIGWALFAWQAWK